MEENDELYLANPIKVNEKPIINNFENKGKKKGIDKVIAFYDLDCCLITIYLFFSIVFIVFPFFFYFLLFRATYKKILYIDEEETELVECNQGICGCCICCFYDKNTHIIKEINKVILYIESNSNSNRKTVNCELYMVNGEKKEFFKNWRVKEENLNELEAFFRRHFDIQIVDVKEQKAYTNK